MKALIVDDDPVIREYLRNMVTDEGAVLVTEADTGTSGLARWKLGSPDIIFLDIHLPDLDGLEVLKKIRESDSRVYVVVVTGHVSVSTVQEIVKLNADQYIVKPLDQKRIHQAVESAKRRAA